MPEWHTDSPQLNNTLQLLAEYIQYKCTPLKRTTPHNCWQNIFNTNIYLKTCKCPNLVPEGHTDSPQLNNTLQLLAAYIQYKCTTLKRTTPHNCWQNISNTNIYLKTYKCPNLVLEGHTDSPQLNNTPQLLAEHIQYRYLSQNMYML